MKRVKYLFFLLFFTTPMMQHIHAQVFTAKGVDFEMIKVEGGTFTMGNTWDSADVAHAQKSIRLRSFTISKTEVTQELWAALMPYNPSRNDTCALCPVENITWADAQEFILKLNKTTKKTFRLPTEAEWEYAARGGDKSKHTQYSGGSNIDDVAWYSATTQSHSSKPVATKMANELGIYDMTGNVFEWCYDWSENRHHANAGSTDKNTEDEEEDEEEQKDDVDRVIRGGSWLGGAPEALIYYRRVLQPSYKGGTCGIRLVYAPL